MSYPELPDYLIREIAAHTNYKDLQNLCETFAQEQEYENPCDSDYFWKLKTYYDFGSFYDIELSRNLYGVSDLYLDYGPGWYETYQYYRSFFSKEFIEALAANPKDKDLIYNTIDTINKKGFLIVDETDDNGNTALIVASMKGYRDIVQFLLSQEGADPDIRNDNGDTALILASKYAKDDVVSILLDYGANINQKNNKTYTALMKASKKGNESTVELLLNRIKNSIDIDLNLKDRGYNIETMVNAIVENYRSRRFEEEYDTDPVLSEVRDLLDVYLNVIDYGYDLTALMWASRRGYVGIVELLLNNAADPDFGNDYGRTALEVASGRGYEEIVELLLSGGANPNRDPRSALTPLMRAASENRFRIVEMLLEAGALPNTRDGQEGATALHYFLSNGGYPDIARLLLRYGADPYIEDNYGESAINLARNNGYDEIVAEMEDLYRRV